MADTSKYTNADYDAARRAAYRHKQPYTGGEDTGSKELPPPLRENLGTRRVPKVSNVRFPDADPIVGRFIKESQQHQVDVLLVNPPAPDGGIWIRSQHRVGRRSRENMIWPQVELATMAACLQPEYTVEGVDALGQRLNWAEFEELVTKKRPKYYLTQVTAPTLTNDMYGVFLAKSKGAKTIAFGTHVTPNTINTMNAYPALDYILRGEPELTLRELVDALDGKTGRNEAMADLMR